MAAVAISNAFIVSSWNISSKLQNIGVIIKGLYKLLSKDSLKLFSSSA